MSFGFSLVGSTGNSQVNSSDINYVCVHSSVISGDFFIDGLRADDIIATTYISGRRGVVQFSKYAGKTAYYSFGTSRILIFRVQNSLPSKKGYGIEVYSDARQLCFSSEYPPLLFNPSPTDYHALLLQKPSQLSVRITGDAYVPSISLDATFATWVTQGGALGGTGYSTQNDFPFPKGDVPVGSSTINTPSLLINATGIPLNLRTTGLSVYNF